MGNEEYVWKLAENVQRGFREKRFARGKWSGSPPLGYRMGYEEKWNPDKDAREAVETGLLVADHRPRERDDGAPYTNAELALMIGELYATGRMGARPLAAHLNARGYGNAKGRPFSGGSIRHIIENPAYNGWTTWHQRVDKRRPGEPPTAPARTHEALWSDELWAKVQSVRARAHHGANCGQLRNTYTFRRLVVCDRCGRRMYGESHAHKNQRPDLYYGCIVAREQKACDQRGVRQVGMEGQVAQWLDGVSGHDFDEWGSVEAALAQEAETVVPTRQIDSERIQRQLAAAKHLYSLGDMTPEEYTVRTRSLKAQLNEDVPVGGMSAETLSRAAARFDDLARLWLAATAEERADIAQALFEEVRVRDRSIVSVRLADETLLPVVARYVAATTTGAPPDGLEPPTPALGRLRSVH